MRRMRISGGNKWQDWISAQAGFTLLEVIVVIIIVGILAGLLTPLATISLRRAKIKQTEEKMEILNNSLLLYYEHEKDASGYLVASFPTDTNNDPADLTVLESTGYISESEYADDYAYDAWRVPLVYTYNVGAVSATLRSYGPNRTDDSGGGDDIVYIVQAKDIWKKWRRIAQERLEKVNEAVEEYKRAGKTIATGDDSTVLSAYLDAGTIYDPWGRPFKYDESLSTFYSYGADGTPGSGDEVYPAGLETTP